jgi:phage terminase large subunit-like protein
MSSNKTDVINYDEETQAEEYGTGELEKIKGVVANQKTNIAITENDSDWLAGKVKGDKKAADRFAEKFWSEEQTEKLKNQINNSEKKSSEKCRYFCKSTETCKTSDIYRGKNYHRTYKQSRFGR